MDPIPLSTTAPCALHSSMHHLVLCHRCNLRHLLSIPPEVKHRKGPLGGASVQELARLVHCNLFKTICTGTEGMRGLWEGSPVTMATM